jgi:anti-sigma-K factor RskA
VTQGLMPLALAASVLIALGALYYAWTLRRDVNELTQIVRIMQAPDLLRVDLKGQATASGAIGRAMWSRSGGLMFMADRLPPLPAGRVYQLWTITGTAATSAGLLTPDANGSAAIRVNVPASAPRPDAFGVTIEPAGGSPAPTLPIVLLGSAGQ